VGAANPDANYAGDIDCLAAWALLEAEPTAQLVDVRTAAEWNFVGLPDLSSLGKRVLTVEWQSYPSMALNAHFASRTAELLAAEDADRDAPVLLICRSGARSRAAAIALTRAGYTKAYNVAGGFEGDLDPQHHRATRNGWKSSGLPWRQS